MRLKNIQITAASLMVACLSTGVQAATYGAIQDTYVYEFLGNQGLSAGDSQSIGVWNHEGNHGAQGLLQFDSSWVNDAALSGNYTATLNLYSSCAPTQFLPACVGDDGSSTTTDVVIQGGVWDEADASLVWTDVTQSSVPSTSFTQNSNIDGWISIDVTDMLAYMLNNSDYGFALTQEAYEVVRTSEGIVAVSSFCDSESSAGACAAGTFSPYLEITAVPVPGAIWLFVSGLVGVVGVMRRRET